jgi:hypothetical protein
MQKNRKMNQSQTIQKILKILIQKIQTLQMIRIQNLSLRAD